ncbi:MAG TPA: P-type conjugative transfer protein VirB9 [Micavibrio sp.]|nr:P-type conjugative transfer protein VirB9 [Micavibrio sp.]
MIKNALLSTALLSLLISPPALAGTAPKPGAQDARVKSVRYVDGEVYAVKAHYGYSTAIEFADHEEIETISIGDSATWQVIKPSRPNMLFIKPLIDAAATNLTVITSKRVYSFTLNADTAGSYESDALTYRLRFSYPQEQLLALDYNQTGSLPFDPLADTPASALNFEYSYAGAKRLRPSQAFDDGQFTYLKFTDADSLPAVFAVDEDGNERLVNFNVYKDMLVITGTNAQFTLRDGDTATCIFNDAKARDDQIITKPIPVAALDEKDLALTVPHAFPLPARKPDYEALMAARNQPALLSRLASVFVVSDEPLELNE